MSALSNLVGTTDDNDHADVDGKQEENGLDLPAWSWGAIGGGIALLTAAGVATWHFVGRRVRARRARESALLLIHEQSESTPREGTPRSVPLQAQTVATQAKPKESETII